MSHNWTPQQTSRSALQRAPGKFEAHALARSAVLEKTAMALCSLATTICKLTERPARDGSQNFETAVTLRRTCRLHERKSSFLWQRKSTEKAKQEMMEETEPCRVSAEELTRSRI